MSKLQSCAAIAAIIGVIIAAIALIPAFGQWLNLRAPTSGPAAVPSPIQPVGRSESITWQLNPALPSPHGYQGWIRNKTSNDFESGIWKQGVKVSVTRDELLLVFGGLARLPNLGEIGTKTSCFVVASRGPLNISLDLMSARLEVHDVDASATSSAWAAQKAKALQEAYPSTCGKGLDIAVGK